MSAAAPAPGPASPEPVRPRRARSAAAPERRLRVVGEFQSDAAEIEDSPPPPAARATLYAVAVLILGAVLWASLAEIDEIVAAPGRLVTTAPSLVVQPLETAVIRSLEVAAGDTVHAGQVLARLDPTFTQADVGQLRARLAASTAQIARLEAEIAGRDYAPGPAAGEEERLQAALFAQRREHLDAELRGHDEHAAQIEAGIATSRRDQDMLAARLDVLREIEAMRASLMAREVGSRITLLEARNQRLEAEASLAHLHSGLDELAHQLETVRAERQTAAAEFRRAALDDLVRLRRERDAAAEELSKAERRRQLVELRAPADGVVLELAQRSVGSVVREAEPLVTLVPLDVPLEAEIMVPARDIGRLALGQEVRVKLDAFPFQRHGTAAGELRTLSEDAFARPGASGGAGGAAAGLSGSAAGAGATGGDGAFYRARVRLTAVALRDLPPSFRLIPGMTVVAEIRVGRRRVLSYFLDPLLRGLDQSLREP